VSWDALVKPALRDAGPYEPGPSLDELKALYGLDDVAKLNWNEGLWGPLPGVLDAVAEALGEVWAYPEHAYNALREAIAAETGAQPAQVLPGHGIQALVLTLVGAVVRPGDAVVVPDLTYGLYAQACRVAGAEVVRVEGPELRVDLERLGAAARETDARLVWVCDPNNPTGLLVESAEWRALLDAVPPRCLVVADEAYMDYVEPAARPGRERDVAEGRRVVVLRTFSKIFGLAGLRLGYALADPGLVRFLHAVQEPFNVNRAALAAGLASLGRPAEVAARRDAAAAARERLAAALAAGGVRPMPSGANFVLCELGTDDGALGDRLLRRGVLVRPGTELGLPGWARITVGPDALMDRAAAALLAVRAELLAAGMPAA
jgi:histidinol-phosphate aminotransferase